MDAFFIFVAKYLVGFSIVIGGFYFLVQPRLLRKKILLLAIISGLLAGVIALIASRLYVDPRPFVVGNFIPLIAHAPDNGFPSDHALLTGWIASVVFAYRKRVGLLLWGIAILVGVARVYVGVHHPIDIIGAFVICLVATVVGYRLTERIVKKESSDSAVVKV